MAASGLGAAPVGHGVMTSALERYFLAVNRPADDRAAKLRAVVASFEDDATVTAGGVTTTPALFYDSPISAVLQPGFRAEAEFGTLLTSLDGKSAAISIKLVPGGRDEDAFFVGDWFTLGDTGRFKHLLVHGPPPPPPPLPPQSATSKRARGSEDTGRARSPTAGGGTHQARSPAGGRKIKLSGARPYPYVFPLQSTALMLIDFQRDFLLPGGFGATLGNDVSQLIRAVAPAKEALTLARQHSMHVVHTREGHVSNLSDLQPSKLRRGNPPPGKRIGDMGGMGRILVDGEDGCAIVPELTPTETELNLLKPGKGAFWNTPLEAWLRERGISHLIIGGVVRMVTAPFALVNGAAAWHLFCANQPHMTLTLTLTRPALSDH
jgi:nicotinamidase-related amidase